MSLQKHKSLYLAVVAILFVGGLIAAYNAFIYAQSPEVICQKNTLQWEKNEYKTVRSQDDLQITLQVRDKAVDSAQFFPIILAKKDSVHCAVSFTTVDAQNNLPENVDLGSTSQGITAKVFFSDGEQSIPVADVVLNLQGYILKNKNHVFNIDEILSDAITNYSVQKNNEILTIHLKTRITTDEYIVDIVRLHDKKIATDSIELVSTDGGKTWEQKR